MKNCNVCPEAPTLAALGRGLLTMFPQGEAGFMELIVLCCPKCQTTSFEKASVAAHLMPKFEHEDEEAFSRCFECGCADSSSDKQYHYNGCSKKH